MLPWDAPVPCVAVAIAPRGYREPRGGVLTRITCGYPGTPGSATVQTYDDHRMAMSFALLGLRAPGIRIADPGCVAKTFPGFWAALEALRSGVARP